MKTVLVSALKMDNSLRVESEFKVGKENDNNRVDLLLFEKKKKPVTLLEL